MQQTSWWQKYGVYVALLLLAVVLTLPVFVFLSSRGLDWALIVSGKDPHAAKQLFPLFGLVAFTIAWFQVMLGSNGWWLYPRVPSLFRLHIVGGITAFCFAVLHPLLLILGFGFNAYLHKTFVSAGLRIYVTIGTVQLTLLTFTVLAGLLRRTPWLRRHWRKVHVLNYAVFVLVWVHSWFLGTDVQATALRYLWMFFALSVFVSFVLRMLSLRRQHPRPLPVQPQPLGNEQPVHDSRRAEQEETHPGV